MAGFFLLELQYMLVTLQMGDGEWHRKAGEQDDGGGFQGYVPGLMCPTNTCDSDSPPVSCGEFSKVECC